MSKIYKYFGEGVIDLVFAKDDFCNVKCSYPNDYNDPYELFLAVKRDLLPEHIAFYNEVISELPQFPTSCFSQSPIASPMWAHYANNHSGFVLEFDLEKLQEKFEGNPVWEVSYRTEPHPNLSQILARAAQTLKPRHVKELQDYTFVEAYFAKYDEWSYEKEVRFVDTLGVTTKIAEMDILEIPMSCVTKILVGPRASEEFVSKSLDVANDNGISWLKQVIGKSNPKPYFLDATKAAYRFENGELAQADKLCISCTEPLIDTDDQCPWCRVTDQHAENAAMNNPFRMLEKAGLLEKYLKNQGALG
ncbi:DUF2971 domain-containing protein [Vibrio aestuarianus]|uniref:DUF2971 domain-containing protein n=1 Tax=Vibrio aestuarianus TaxID=28171 RepID=UPI004068C09B